MTEERDNLPELPQGWLWALLGDLCDIHHGYAFKSEDFADSGPIVLTPGNFTEQGELDFLNKRVVRLSGAYDEQWRLKNGDLLVVMTDLSQKKLILGSATILDSEEIILHNQRIGLVVPYIDEVSRFYLRYSIISPTFKKYISETASGTLISHTSPTKLLNGLVPIAPLNEQRRIVAKIEALKARSQRVKEELEAIAPLLDQFRQSVLAAAFRGDLTADWREKNPDVETSSVLLERIQEKRQKRYEEECKKAEEEGRRKPKDQTKNKKSDKSALEIAEIPESWVLVRLEDVSYLVTDGTHKTPKYQAEGVPFLSVKNVRPFLVKDEDVKFISEEEHQEINARCNPEKGDILYTKVGATFGYAAINELDYSFSIFVSLALIKPVHPYFSSEYAEVIMNSEIVFTQARERVSGIGTPDLHLIEIRDFRIPLPPLEEQQEIVSRVQTFFKIADKVEQQYKEAQAYLDQLDRSILAKAFRGELVPQDPNDEPASVLLERIRAEREKLDIRKKAKGKTEKKSRKAKPEAAEPEQLSLPGFE